MKTKLTEYTQDEVQALEGPALDWAVLLAMGGRCAVYANGYSAIFMLQGQPHIMCHNPYFVPYFETRQTPDPLALLQEMFTQGYPDLAAYATLEPNSKRWQIMFRAADTPDVILYASDPATAIKRAYVLWKLREAEA